MLTDRLPIDSENPESIRQKLGTPSPLSPHLYCTDIPLPVSEVVTRLLERDPDMRFPDAASLRTALDASIDQLIIDGPESEATVQGWEDDRAEEDGGPLDLDTLYAVESRQPWETPAITAVNQPAEAMVAFKLQSDSVEVVEEQWVPEEEESEPDPINELRGQPGRDDLRVIQHLQRRSDFEMVFYNRSLLQAVFRRRPGGAS